MDKFETSLSGSAEMHRVQREKNIRVIEESIRKSLKKAGAYFSYEDIIIQTAANCFISRRTAKEYVDIALYRLGLAREDFEVGDGNKKITANVKTHSK